MANCANETKSKIESKIQKDSFVIADEYEYCFLCGQVVQQVIQKMKNEQIARGQRNLILHSSDLKKLHDNIVNLIKNNLDIVDNLKQETKNWYSHIIGTSLDSRKLTADEESCLHLGMVTDIIFKA